MDCIISGENVRETGQIKKDQSTSDAISNVKEKEQFHYIPDQVQNMFIVIVSLFYHT